jgi:hypothetical protein
VAFEVGHIFGKWEKSELGFSKKIGNYKVPDYMDGKILCLLLP